MHHVPGLKNRAPDAVSRQPSGPSEPAKMHLPDDVALIKNRHIDHPPTNTIFTALPLPLPLDNYETTQEAEMEEGVKLAAVSAISSLQSVTWDKVRLETNSDPDMSVLVDIIQTGMPPDRHDLPVNLQPYHQFRDHLSTIDGVAIIQGPHHYTTIPTQ